MELRHLRYFVAVAEAGNRHRKELCPEAASDPEEEGQDDDPG